MKSSWTRSGAAVLLGAVLAATAYSETLTGPEHAQSIELAFEQRADGIFFSVPRINVYEVAVVEFR